MNTKNILIVAINSHNACIFKKTEKKGGRLTLIEKFTAELDAEHKIPDRTFNSTGSLRHAIEPHTDRRDVQKQDFSAKIAKIIEEKSNANEFDDLILFGPDKILNLVTASLNKGTNQKITKKFNKNLLDFKTAEMEEAILKYLEE